MIDMAARCLLVEHGLTLTLIDTEWGASNQRNFWHTTWITNMIWIAHFKKLISE
jgi:hypothetical protein